jgi:hypothetical protein
MASWHAAAAEVPVRARPPRAKPAPKKRQAASRRKAKTGVTGGLVWIVVGGVLLAGIVALNVAVLRLNIRLDHLNNQSQQLQAQNAALGAKLSASVSSPRIQGLAKASGYVPADPGTIGYVDLTPRRAR